MTEYTDIKAFYDYLNWLEMTHKGSCPEYQTLHLYEIRDQLDNPPRHTPDYEMCEHCKYYRGGFLMAVKTICDRCGAEINPVSSITKVKTIANYETKNYDLCVSCAFWLKKYLNNEAQVEEG